MQFYNNVPYTNRPLDVWLAKRSLWNSNILHSIFASGYLKKSCCLNTKKWKNVAIFKTIKRNVGYWNISISSDTNYVKETIKIIDFKIASQITNLWWTIYKIMKSVTSNPRKRERMPLSWKLVLSWKRTSVAFNQDLRPLYSRRYGENFSAGHARVVWLLPQSQES